MEVASRTATGCRIFRAGALGLRVFPHLCVMLEASLRNTEVAAPVRGRLACGNKHAKPDFRSVFRK